MKYVCKYTPVELLAGFGIEAELLNPAAESFELSDQHIHSNVCSFSRSITEVRLRNSGGPLILTTCCDSIELQGSVKKPGPGNIYSGSTKLQ